MSKSIRNPTFMNEDFLHKDTWRIFKIMSEFVEGFEELSAVHKAVAFFGSKRASPQGKYYKLAYEVARLFSQKGFSILSGAGPGIMEAANKGARAGRKGLSVGLNILIPEQQKPHLYVDYLIEFKYFFVRKVMFAKYSKAFIVFPGGYGTLDECFEALALIQTGRIERVPVILAGKDFWKGLTGWFQDTLIPERTLTPQDLEGYKVIDDPAQIVREVERFYSKK